MQFAVIPADDFIWNHNELLDFLIANQGQAIELTTNAEGCCADAIGLYSLLDRFEFESVKIRTANPIEQHDKYSIEITAGGFLNVDREIDPQYHTWNQQRIFGTIYARPLWHRIGIATHLSVNYPDKSTVGFIADSSNIDSRALFELQQLWTADPATASKFLLLSDSLPWRHSAIGEYRPGRPDSSDYIEETLELYPNFLIDVVAESFTSGNCCFVTEKTVRPMMMKKPFIAMAPANYLDYLHQMGFKTFNDFWSEEYDGFTSYDRYAKILKLIDNLAAMPMARLQEMYQAMQPILAHNYQLLISKTYNRDIKIIQ